MAIVTKFGSDQGGADSIALYLPKFGGDVYSTFRKSMKTEGMFLEQTLTEAKETRERYTGPIISHDFTRGTNLLVNADDNDIPENQKFADYLIRLDDPHVAAENYHDFDYLMSPAGDQDRMRITEAMGEAVAYAMDLRRYSTLLQAASAPQKSVFPTTNPYITKPEAGDSQHAAFSTGAGGVADSMCGLHVDANLTPALADGKLVEDILFKFQDYFDILNVPEDGRVCLIKPQLLRKIVKDSGTPSGVGWATTAAPTNTFNFQPSKTLNRLFGGAGDVTKGTVGMAAGFQLVPSNHLINLGTKIDNYFSPADAAGSKYAPGTAFLTTTVFGLNGFSPANAAVFEQNAAANQPTQWDGAASTTKEAFNAVQLICFHRSACKTNILQGMITRVTDEHSILGYLLTARMTVGHGYIRPEAVVYAANVKSA